ncbi:protein lines [Condylostylus longicornis]|uniref:protein lines n=1 Tax=Condylostylus longicornis TaxID=2530218 RepID=UPI00244DE1AE|nr:protein lines [Condylostylus longicornis]XP_055383395.1 protein lines [Condylostylus longicornis]XP_055383396.1 protein lines [Condylostylus longicornis]
MSNEQPVSKRQRIENSSRPNSSIDKTNTTNTLTKTIQTPDILAIGHQITDPSEHNGNSHKISAAISYGPNSMSSGCSSSCSTSTSPTSSLNSSTDEVDKVNNHTNIPESTSNREIPDLIKNNVSKSNRNIHCLNKDVLQTTTTRNEMADFEGFLVKQCLCEVSETTLRRPFESHYHEDSNGTKRIANLSEWPTSKLMQFLSNLQLLFDIYLKQNSKGFICSRIMDICDALIRNDHNLIDEIIELANFNNKFVQFIAGRVLASFLVIAKHNMNDDWLKKLIDNLFCFERMDYIAIRKMHFSLEIIKQIVEWKDIDIHPLEDELNDQRNAGISHSQASSSSSTSAAQQHQQPQFHPRIENNYFAINFNREMDREAGGSSSNNIDNEYIGRNERYISNDNDDNSNSSQSPSHVLSQNGCHLISLTDSESFDTTHLKCVTIKILENKWPALVKNMSQLISSFRNVTNAENCILTFLVLWENIISVKANLSIVETLPFYAQLDKFELLLNQELSCTIYKQMLSLFNEALCYGSTLALQDLLPEETCMLAHQIVRHVKDFRILDSLPRRQPENSISLIGYKGRSIIYENTSLDHISENDLLASQIIGDDDGTEINSNINDNHTNLQIDSNDIPDMDKTILQKIVLLVLKSVAVTVKEIRSDSSDSSIDSTDYDAFQDMVLIERSIRDVLKKLESFIKNTLEFHPECHFSKILIHLFDDQDDHLIEAMVCTLDVTAGISFRNNAFPELVAMLNPVYTFLEFLKMISNSSDLLLDLLVSNETCFLLYLLRFLKYIRINWSMFISSCREFDENMGGSNCLDDAMSVLIRLRLQISRLVSKSLYPYDISPILRLLESCESLYEGNELS